MSHSYMTNPLVFVISTLFHLYAFALMLRFILQQVRADFYNPLSQFIVRITTPVVQPARRIVPSIKGFDTATLLVCFLVLILSQAIVQALSNMQPTILTVVVVAITDLVSLTINVFFYAILIQAIMSWVNPYGNNPISGVLYSVTAPVLKPVQKIIPPMGGMDISPIFALLGLKVVEMLINPLFFALLR